EDLPRATVGAIPDTTGALYLETRGISARTFETPEAAVRALRDQEIDAVVYDAPILSHLARQLDADRVEVLPERLDSQMYAFALPEDSTLHDALDVALLRRIQSDEWERLVASYLGD
ncbi:MAG: transporter substrate-binding domain-containing protein, partial [Thermoanaerobaculia bacterium]|nr:transporter substrate-binding domain-containing protein [Thermoanaerobaculia bacterium]